MVVGYTTGVFDLFHIGHLNILRNAKSMCDKLVVGVTTDELMLNYKKKQAVCPYEERSEIVRSICYVDTVIPQAEIDKYAAWQKIHFNVLFVGDDWHGTPKWQEIEAQLKAVDVRVVYFPYTKGTSSSLINEFLIAQREAMLAPGHE